MKTVTEAQCKQAIEKWGVPAQLDMVIEECSELIKSIIKLRRGQGEAADIVAEAVDVENMIKQLMIIFPGDEWPEQREASAIRLKWLLKQKNGGPS